MKYSLRRASVLAALLCVACTGVKDSNSGPAPPTRGAFDESTTTIQVAPGTTERQVEFKATFITPAGEPTNAPIIRGKGQNEYVFDSSDAARLQINIRIRVEGMESLEAELHEFRLFITEVPGSTWQWATGNERGRPGMDGRDHLVASVTLMDLPKLNSSFGRKTIRLLHKSRLIATQPFEIFYPAKGTNWPKDQDRDPVAPKIPNWFHYYKQNIGGDDAYNYECSDESRRSHGSAQSSMASVDICDDAFDGDAYIRTEIMNGRLRVIGSSRDIRYYAAFVGVLSHERHHVLSNENSTSAPDSDKDGLSDKREREEARTDPEKEFSARDNPDNSATPWILEQDTPEERQKRLAMMTDAEIHANGPIEENAAENADTSADWACPGTNYGAPECEVDVTQTS